MELSEMIELFYILIGCKLPVLCVKFDTTICLRSAHFTLGKLYLG